MSKNTVNVEIVPRKEWNAHQPTGEIQTMLVPVTHVRFTHTATGTCSSVDECKKVLRKIQFEHMDTYSFNDISYNFMIGGDGRVYEGRGWDKEPNRPTDLGNLVGISLEIAYIGDFEDDAPPPAMMRTALDLMTFAMKNKKIHHYFDGMHLT